MVNSYLEISFILPDVQPSFLNLFLFGFIINLLLDFYLKDKLLSVIPDLLW